MKKRSYLLLITVLASSLSFSAMAALHSVRTVEVSVGRATSMEMVRPREGFVVRPVSTFSMRLAKGEKEGLQVLVSSESDLEDVKVRVSDLTLRSRRQKGEEPAVLPKAAIDCDVVGYVYAKFKPDSKYTLSYGYCEKTATPPGYVRKAKKAKDGWYPDMLLDFLDGVSVKAGDVQGFWVRVNCPEGQKPGLYDGVIEVSGRTADSGAKTESFSMSYPFSVRVYGFSVPKESPLPLAISWAPMAHREVDTKEAKEEALKNDMDPEGPVALARNRIDEWGEFLADRYITLDCLYTGGPYHPYYRTMEPRWQVLKRLRSEGRLGYFNLGYWNYFKTAEGEQYWHTNTMPRLRRNYRKAKELGLLDRAYLYGCDEVSVKYLPNIRRCAEMLKKEFPGVPVATTAYDHSFGVGTPASVLDWFTPSTAKYNREKADAARREGRKVGWYICCGPSAPWANAFNQCSPSELRMLMGAQTVRMRPDGFLYYALALWNSKRPVSSGPFTDWNPRSYMDMNGDGCWTAAGPGGKPLSTLRLENFRDGLEDYAYVLELEKRLSAHPDAPWADRAKKLIAVPESVMQSMSNFTDDPNAVYAWRDAIAECIEIADGRVDAAWELADECSFRMTLCERNGDRLGRQTIVRSSEMDAVCDCLEGGRLVRTWRGHRLLGADFTATATFEKGEGGAVECNFRYSGGNPSGLFVESVGFPDVKISRTDATRILYSKQQGCIKLPRWEKLKEDELIAGGLPQSFHFIAALNPEGDSLYLDNRGDARIHATRLEAINGADGQVHLVSWYDLVVDANTTRSFIMPFPSTFRKFCGDWFDAAKIYRDWAKKQPFYKASAARGRGRLADIAMWFWNRGRSDHVIPPVERFMKDSGVPAALDWYWWHNIPYDSQYPHFWPPRESEELFRAAVQRCKGQGIFVQPYVNGMTWDCDISSWKDGGEQGVVVERDGSARAVMFNRFTKHRLAYMCGESAMYQRHMRSVVAKLADCGFDAVYMDMINNAAWGACWNPRHSHGLGGGTHMVENFRKYVNEVRKDNPGLMLSSEDGCEAYLECFDSAISLYANFERFTGGTMPYTEFVPCFNAIYHPCITTYGSFAMIDGIPAFDEKWPTGERWNEEKRWDELFPHQFAVELARGVTWGIQPCVHNFTLAHATDRRFAQEYRFMVDTAKFWHENRKWLLEGEMCSPGVLKCERGKVDFMRRGTYALKGEYAVCSEPSLPYVFHSVWKSPDGKVAAVLVNWTRNPRKWRLDAPDISGEGVLPPRSWRLVFLGAQP